MDHPPSAYRWMHLWLYHRSPQGRCKITSTCDLPSSCDLPSTTCSIVWSVRLRRHPPRAPHCRLHDVAPSSSPFARIVHLETPPPPRRPRRSPRHSPTPCTRAVVQGYRAATSTPPESCTRAVVFAYVDRLTLPVLHRSPFMMLHNHSSWCCRRFCYIVNHLFFRYCVPAHWMPLFFSIVSPLSVPISFQVARALFIY